jgi:hypothetical protein
MAAAEESKTKLALDRVPEPYVFAVPHDTIHHVHHDGVRARAQHERASQAVGADIGDLIKRVLQRSDNMTAHQIVLALNQDGYKFERSEVNSWLYKATTFVKRTEDFPPKWSRIVVSAPPPVEIKRNIIVAVDLGNVHDCLEPLTKILPHIPELQVYAFADKAYNYIGAKGKEITAPRLTFWQNTSDVRESTDVKMIRIVFSRLDTIKSPCEIYLCSVDKLFVGVADVINGEGVHKAVICRSWNDLHMHIE